MHLAVSLDFIKGSVIKELTLLPHSDLFSSSENQTGKCAFNSEFYSISGKSLQLAFWQDRDWWSKNLLKILAVLI